MIADVKIIISIICYMTVDYILYNNVFIRLVLQYICILFLKNNKFKNIDLHICTINNVNDIFDINILL